MRKNRSRCLCRRPRRPASGDRADVLKLHISRIRLDVNHIPTRRIACRRTRSIRTGNGRYVGKRWIQESVGVYRDARGRPAGRGAGAKLRLEQEGLLGRLGFKRLRESAVLALETNDSLCAQGQIVLAFGAKAQDLHGLPTVVLDNFKSLNFWGGRAVYAVRFRVRR